MFNIDKVKYQSGFSLNCKKPYRQRVKCEESCFSPLLCLREELSLLTFLVFSTFLCFLAFSICLLPTLQSFSQLQFVLVNSQTGEGCALQAGVYRATAAQ